MPHPYAVRDVRGREAFALADLHGWQPSPDDPTRKRLHEVVRVHFPTVRAFRAALRHGAVLGAAPWEGKVDPIMMFFDRTGLAPCGWLRCTSSDGTTSC
eukprot:scaffold44218_cov44-Tisochrysis_lutea.AAC.1